MSSFGSHLKLSIDRALRDDVRRFYTEGFGARQQSPSEALDQFIFDDGGSVGVFYVTAAQALPEAAWEFAPWLEYHVDDPEAVAARLVALGAARVDFMDRTHPYLRGPGGPVFRLAKG